MSCRELAYQIAEQFRVLGKPLGLKDCIIVGGMGKNSTVSLSSHGQLYKFCSDVTVFAADMMTQALELSSQPHVVVATPGRLADHIRSSNTFSMNRIQFLVSVWKEMETFQHHVST